MYEYRAEIETGVDGVTVDDPQDLGIDVRIDLTLRLAGINAPEMSTNAGKTARAWLLERLTTPAGLATLTVRTVKDRKEKFGRYLAYLIDGAGVINDEMVRTGHAVPYDGGAR